MHPVSEGAGSGRHVLSRLLTSVVARAFLFGAVWWALVEGNPIGFLGWIAVFGSTAASFALLPPGSWRWHAGGLLRFIPFFLVQSFLGGVDVALRALRPGPPILPAFSVYPISLPDGPARVFFVTAHSLLPGTLSVTIVGDELRVHMLHRGIAVRDRTERLEQLVARLFGHQVGHG